MMFCDLTVLLNKCAKQLMCGWLKYWWSSVTINERAGKINPAAVNKSDGVQTSSLRSLYSTEYGFNVTDDKQVRSETRLSDIRTHT